LANETQPITRAGFVAIAGAPNVGKSTFLNQVLGVKVAITCDKPQTTRHRLLGVYNREGLQIVFLDTPGLHQANRALNRMMVRTAVEALKEADAALFMVEATPRGLVEASQIVDILTEAARPTVVALNKIDLVKNKAELLPMIEEISSWGQWKAIVPTSAIKNEGLEEVINELEPLIPEGPPLFPPDMITDLPVRFLAGEIIREKIFHLTHKEVPYSTAVEVEQFIEPEEDSDRPVVISATIYVERPSQKAIIIGKEGAMLKRIGTAARKELELLLGRKVFLELYVKVEPNWTRREQGLKKVGYRPLG